MESLPDTKTLGIMGFSGGGMVAALTSVLDERIQATVLSGFAGTFKDGILSTEHCLDNYVPGLLEIGELPELIGLISPRALFIEFGKQDDCFPLGPALETISFLEALFQTEGQDRSFSSDIFEGGHEVNGRKAYDWLDYHLSLS